MKGNVIVGQSGGPTAAINSSLAGVYCVWDAAWHSGIDGRQVCGSFGFYQK